MAKVVQFVLVFSIFLRPVTAVRANDFIDLPNDTVEEQNEGANLSTASKASKVVNKREAQDCDRTWGDAFETSKGLLLPLDYAWLGLCGVIAVGVLIWAPPALRVDAAGPSSKLQPMPWYRAAFQSITSHAAGIVGFAGFQKILVSRILMTGDPCKSFSLDFFLLCATLTLSIIAVTTSCVFLCVDYMRRLTIDTARQKGFRLMLKPRVLEETGLGRSILFFTGLMLLLYVLEIAKEVCGNEADDPRWYLRVLPSTAGGCATVALFYINLRGLHQSPKVQFDSTCHSLAEERTLEQFLHESSSGAPFLSDWATRGLRKVAGEDLALLATYGSREAFFPQQRWAPLCHVLFGLLFLGLAPLGVQLISERLLFLDPELDDLKELTGSFAEIKADDQHQLMGMASSQRQFLLLPSLERGKIQVTPNYQQTSRIRLCCDSCKSIRLNHSLTKFHNEPVMIELPVITTNYTNCTLSLLGLSKGVLTNVSVVVVPKKTHRFCDCSGRICRCCDPEKFQGEWDFRRPNETTLAKLNGTICVRADPCRKGYERLEVTDNCTPAMCDVANSDKAPGPLCSCLNGFVGNISWKDAVSRGPCLPADCSVNNSNLLPGLSCECRDGFQGSITWNGSRAEGNCTPAPCDVEGSNKQPGLNCECKERYVGKISWNKSQASGSCEEAPCIGKKLNGERGGACECRGGFEGLPARHGDILTDVNCKRAKCNIPNSTGNGPKCRCKDGFSGNITWEGAEAHGVCTPAPCAVPNSNMKAGLECECSDLYAGNITWNRSTHRGICAPRICLGNYTNLAPGPSCSCVDGYDGPIRPGQVDGQPVLVAECEPIPCTRGNSDRQPGPLCKCLDGFVGKIVWEGKVPYGTCKAAPCNIENSNLMNGPQCECMPGFDGVIRWFGERSLGKCTPLPCKGDNVNGVAGPGCRCADGFIGEIQRRKEDEVHTTLPQKVPKFDGKDDEDDKDDEDWQFFPYEDDDAEEDYVLEGSCQPAPCNVENSNKAPGWDCGCKDGYSGKISWEGPIAIGSCQPSACSVPNSNQVDGPNCSCLDGYQGNISWEGPNHFGTCAAVPCSVLHSDLAAGPDCHCLPGFYGQIRWQGSRVEGECLPLPTCSKHVIHVTWLLSRVEDAEGRVCEAGQQLAFHGLACEDKVVWTSAQSLLGRCKFHLSDAEDETACAAGYTATSPILSAISPPLPFECSEQAGKPICETSFKYTTSSQKAWRQCSDWNDTSEVKLVQVEGRRCGYDLIQWETAQVLGSSPAAGCEIKESLRCGEIPEGVDLPRGCLRMGEPAVFAIERMANLEGRSATQSPEYFVKLFDNGMSAMGRYVDSASPMRWGSEDAWRTDGSFLWMEMADDFVEDYDYFDFFGQRQAGDQDGSRFTHYSQELQMVARAPLPHWWASKFQKTTDPRAFHPDLLDGCRLHFYKNRTCYQIWIGHSVETFDSSGERCAEENLKDLRDSYTYAFSQSEYQTYADLKPCWPQATQHELQLEIVDVPDSQPSLVTMETPCRTNLRYVMDLATLQCNRSTWHNSWNLAKHEAHVMSQPGQNG